MLGKNLLLSYAVDLKVYLGRDFITNYWLHTLLFVVFTVSKGIYCVLSDCSAGTLPWVADCTQAVNPFCNEGQR